MTRLLLVSSDRLLQDCMEDRLRETGWKPAVDRARSLDDAVEVVDRGNVDLALVDLPRLDASSLGRLTAVRRKHPHTHVVLRVGTYPEGLLDELPMNVRRGMSCCLSSLVSWDHLTHLFERLLGSNGSNGNGDSVTASHLFRELNDLGRKQRRQQDEERLDLTPRQREILELMAQGASNDDIAEKLGVARSTVKSHAHHMFRRLGVGDRTEAVALAYRKRWL